MSKLGVSAVKQFNNLSELEKHELYEKIKKTSESLKKGFTSIPPPKTPKPQTRKAHRIRSDESISPRMSKSRGGFSYFNTDTHQNGGRKTVRKVSIKNGKGHKTMTQYKKDKKIFTVKKPLTIIEIVTIQRGQFIPGLFSDCKGPGCMKNKTRKTH
jgi:hypothetical protein